ncbi:MATE family efflux transporter [Peptoniphilus catoniae]|uniref:MATE family efflux transporter n=1 Tax=Peptoniphilus catoniae TaxID=1660341 RepID=UPI001FEBEB49|nr:MATE family efflux transporter [Peptoniphilus catoniae]
MKENKMGTKNIGPLLVEMSLPIMVSMLVQALYNIVDSYFVSRISENAFAAVSLVYPVQYIMTGLGVGTAVGINALLSRSLGEKNFNKANLAAENGILLAFIHYLIFLAFGLILPRIYLQTQTSDPEIIKYGVQYISIVTIFSIGAFMQLTIERIFQSVGKTLYTMFTQIFGMVVNIILDPILIFGLFGFPKMGIAGAAVATVTAQILSACLCAFINHFYNKDVTIKTIRPDLDTIKEIYKVGFPSFALIAVTAMTIYFMNMILGKFTSTAVVALGAYFKVRSFIFLPVFGLNSATIPIVAYNYGAKNKERARRTVELALKVATLIMLVGFVILQVYPDRLLMIFKASDKLLAVGVPALRIISFAYFGAGYNIASSGSFQALGNGVISLNSSIIRQVGALLPIAYLLSLTGNVNMVWWCYPISEFVAFIYCRHYLKNFTFKIIDNL